jgi:hypothetical protein
MKTLFALTIGVVTAILFAHSALAGPERLEAKEMAPST